MKKLFIFALFILIGSSCNDHNQDIFISFEENETLTISESKAIIEKNLSPEGKKLAEIYEEGLIFGAEYAKKYSLNPADSSFSQSVEEAIIIFYNGLDQETKSFLKEYEEKKIKILSEDNSNLKIQCPNCNPPYQFTLSPLYYGASAVVNHINNNPPPLSTVSSRHYIRNIGNAYTDGNITTIGQMYNRVALISADISAGNPYTLNQNTWDRFYAYEFLSATFAAINYMTNNDLTIYNPAWNQPQQPHKAWWKCVGGTIGSGVLGGFTGAGGGSVIPVIGTVAGGVIGGMAGVLIGIASFC